VRFQSGVSRLTDWKVLLPLPLPPLLLPGLV
jgi:hypothetical protein